jgi:hypothetical protein
MMADAREVPVREAVSVEEPTDEIAQLERVFTSRRESATALIPGG